MKKLATLLVALVSLVVATPAFACPNSDHDKQETADQNKKADDAKTAEQPKAKDSKSTEKAADKTKDTVAKKAAAKG
jgi:hypothetical protein